VSLLPSAVDHRVLPEAELLELVAAALGAAYDPNPWQGV
jgi:hypothetical protein